jgi:ATP-dependent Clp protease ATP-binding subunit ClpA
MFERYTEKARRVIFFARYEASQYGSPYIETEHLLLGLMREDHTLARKFPHEKGAEQSIRERGCKAHFHCEGMGQASGKNRRRAVCGEQSDTRDPGLGNRRES